jgi:hypothetical protein
MSLRRATEAHIKWALDPSFVGQPHQVIESQRLEDRPIPCIVIVAGAGNPALPELPSSVNNWNVPITVIVMSSIDEQTVDQHNNVVYTVQQILFKPTVRYHSNVQGLYVYDVINGSQGQQNEGRKLITVLNYELVVNYSPEAPLT